MTRPDSPLGRLGENVAAALQDDHGARERASDSAGRAFSEASMRAPIPRRRGAPVLWWAFACLCVLAALTTVTVHLRNAPLTFRVDGRAGIAQSWLAASSERPLVLSFSDGTRLEVASESRARVVSIDANGAEVALESGLIHAEVVHTSTSAWRLVAGPFTVRVTGTRFDLAWAPTTQNLSLVVHEGSVVVSGAAGGGERTVTGGQTLQAAVTQGRLQVLDTSAVPATEPPAAPETASTEEPAPPTDVPSAPPPPSVAGSSAPREAPAAAGPWRELATHGDLRGAFGAAEVQGFSGICNAASPADLMLLGDAARLSGRSERAEEALLALRRRFPRDPRRTAAAFALGKVAFDQRHNYAKAAQWFETSLREQPNGPLAREAAGRRLEALRNAGDAAGAKRAAADYLAAYPGGPHAAVARQIIQ